MEKVNRRTVKRWGERAGDMSELGAVWNGYSLVEAGKLGDAVEKAGQAVDADYLATAALVSLSNPCMTVYELTGRSCKIGRDRRLSHYIFILNLPL